MRWKEIVLARHPAALCGLDRALVAGQWFVVTVDGRYLGSGRTPPAAWRKAAEHLIRRDTP